MSAAQPNAHVLADNESCSGDDRMLLRVQIHHVDEYDEFVDYLRRLGCTVVGHDTGTFDVFVTHPETVDDEALAIEEWCAAWSRRHRRDEDGALVGWARPVALGGELAVP